MNPVIAVTGLNSGENPQPGPGVIRSLRRRFRDLHIIGLAYGALESSIYADEGADAVYQIPYPSTGIEPLIERLTYIQSREHIDVLIPTLDAEILPLIHARPQLEQLGIRTMLPTLESFRQRSKERLTDLAEAAGINLPESMPVFSESELAKIAVRNTYPIMVKGPYYDAVKARTQEELMGAFHQIMAEWGGPVIIQEYIQGEEFNLAAIGDGTGGILASCPIRKSIRSEKGKGYGGIVVNDPELTAIGQRLMETLQWNGPCELEFIQDEATGRFYLLEINPRFPAWIDFPSTFGYNLPKLLVERILGLESPSLPNQCPTGHFFLRHAVDIAGRIEDLGQLTTHGEFARKTRRTA